ncbi:MAG: sensor histidine kinase, partial [Kofleriaceae bacterium]
MKSAADPVTQKAGDVTTELELLRGRVAELTAQLDLRDDFIAIVGHELRNPLSPLYLLVHLLRQELEHGPPEVSRDAVARHINRIDDGLRRLTLLLDRVFDVSRIGSDQLVLRRERVDLSEHVRTWLVNHDAELHAARCEVRCEIEPGVTGEWDRARIEQILDNVVGNAMR